MKRNGKVKSLVRDFKTLLERRDENKIMVRRLVGLFNVKNKIVIPSLPHLLFSMFLGIKIQKLLLKVADQEDGVMWFLYTY